MPYENDSRTLIVTLTAAAIAVTIAIVLCAVALRNAHAGVALTSPETESQTVRCAGSIGLEYRTGALCETRPNLDRR